MIGQIDTTTITLITVMDIIIITNVVVKVMRDYKNKNGGRNKQQRREREKML